MDILQQNDMGELPSFGLTTTELDGHNIGEMILGDTAEVEPIKTPKEEVKQEEKEPKKEEPKPDNKAILDEILEDETTTETPAEESKEEGSEEPEGFTALAEELSTLGILSFEDGEDLPATGEELRDKFFSELNTRVRQGMYNYIVSQHGEEGWLAFDAIYNKGVSPRDFLTRYTQLESVKDLDITNEGNQEKVVRDYYKRLNWPQEKIDNKVQKLKHLEELSEEAETVHSQLIQTEEQELQKTLKDKEAQNKARETSRAQFNNNLIQTLNASLKEKELEGIPITPKVAQELYNNLYEEKYHIPSTGEKLTQYDVDMLELKKPENTKERIKLYALWNLLKTDPELKTIKRKALTEETSKVFSKAIKATKQTNTQQKSFTMKDFLG